ncbi:MAG: MFS transporter [Candidatus Bathyarchaeia archaeon]
MAHTLTHTFVNTHLALVPLFREEMGISIELVGLMVSIPTLAQALLYLPFGMLSDRFQPHKLIATSLLLSSIGGLIIAQSWNAPMLTLGFSVIAVCLAIFHPPAYSVISELFESKHRNFALGIHGAGGTLGMATGPISVGLIMYIFGQGSWRWNYLLWSFPAFACFLMVIILKPGSFSSQQHSGKSEVPSGEPGLREAFTKTYLLFLILVSFRNFGVQAASTYMTTFLKEVHGIPLDYASILFGSISLMGILAAPIGGIVADKVGERTVLFITYSGQAAALAGIVMSRSLLLLMLFVVIYGFTEFLAMAPMSSLVAQFTPRERRGIAYAAYFLPSTLIGAAAPVVGAFIINRLGVTHVFMLSICLFLLAALVVRVIVRRSVSS